MRTDVRAGDLDGVLSALDDVLERTRREASRIGYFAALYGKVTRRLERGIAAREFRDGERMEAVAVAFANRYLEALAGNRGGGQPTRCWRLAFDAARRWPPIVLQHLLVAMNAHINLDLGIAVAAAVPTAELSAFRGDFDRMNDLLASLVDGVKEELAEVWPAVRRLDRLAGRSDDEIIRFSMSKARRRAWRFAERLAEEDAGGWGRRIAESDLEVALLGRLILQPPPLTRLTTWFVRLRERGTVPEIIDLLR